MIRSRTLAAVTALLALPLLVACDSGSPDDPNIDGTWVLVDAVTLVGEGGTTSEGTITFTYVFTADDGRIEGTYASRVEAPGYVQEGQVLPLTGTYDYPDVTLTIPGPPGYPEQTTRGEVNAAATEIVLLSDFPDRPDLPGVPVDTLRRQPGV